MDCLFVYNYSREIRIKSNSQNSFAISFAKCVFDLHKWVSNCRTSSRKFGKSTSNYVRTSTFERVERLRNCNRIA